MIKLRNITIKHVSLTFHESNCTIHIKKKEFEVTSKVSNRQSYELLILEFGRSSDEILEL